MAAQTVQILRSNTNAPPAVLLPGALFVELGTQTKLWTGAPAGNRLLLSSDPTDTGTAAGGQAFLPLAGGTLTGLLTLSGPPTNPLHAATKAYTDSAISGAVNAAPYVKLVGDTMVGALRLNLADTGTYQLLVGGTSKAVRFQTAAAESSIEGVDQTGFGSWQPLMLGGSYLRFTNSSTEIGRWQGNKLSVLGDLDVNGRAALAQVDFGDTLATRTGYFDGTNGYFQARHIDVVTSAPAGAAQVNIQQTSSAGNTYAQLYLQTPLSGRTWSIHINNSVAEGALAFGAGLTRANFAFASTGRSVFVFDSGNIQTPGNQIFMAGASSAGPYYYADPTNGAFRLGSGNGLWGVQDVNGRWIGGFRADGWGVSLDNRITILNDGSYTYIADGAQRNNIYLGSNGNNHYRNTQHFFESPGGGAQFVIINASGISTGGSIAASGAITAGGNLITNSGNVYGSGWALSGTGGTLNIGTGTTGNLSTLTFYANTVSAVGDINVAGTATANVVNGNSSVNGNYIHSNGNMDAAGDAHIGAVVYAQSVMPSADNGGICGGASAAWNTVESYAFVTKSDAALKEMLGPLPDTLPLVVDLDPQAFQYGGDDALRHWGFVAQDVQAATQDYPVDIVRGEEGQLSVDYGALTAALWRAVQTIEQRLKTLEGA